ncbi:CBL-interacting protein kinase 2-like [Primulina huaijiensis]|uniref:CBL-interacting protein kinase 2-like n=1 Tax=Primulina huaijiensis TaxID=1492673 RepID=UPI003CC70D61
MERQGSMLMQRYEVGKLLGQGTFAKVYHARNLKTNMSVAVKIVDKEKIYKAGMIDQIKREISVMRLVTHPNIVQLYEVMASKTKIFFVMEYVKGGELFNKVAKGKLKEDAAKKYFQQLISAVDFCHSRGVYHRDLKPENLLLDENGNLKVSDFGLSALAESKRQDGLLHTTCGTPAYVAPEVINRRGYDGSKADIWSCGVILYVLLAGYLPFHDSNLMEMYRKIGKAEFKFPNWISPDARKLISKMLDPDPNTRISMSKIMEKSWFRKGFQSKIPRTDAYSKNSNIETEKETAIDADATMKTDLDRLISLNAFDIISLSAGFDLSGLFEKNDRKRELRFTSNQPAKDIISKMEDLAKRLKLKIMKKDGGLLKLEGSKAGRKGVLSIEAEIFEIAPDFHLVEMKKTNGDTLEFQKMMKQDVRPSLKDIVWTWQGDQLLADQQLELSESEPSQVPQLQDHSP